MAFCKYCDATINWGQSEDGKWVKLVPIGEDTLLERTHQDENGLLRAQHRCAGWTPAVKVVRLAKSVPAEHVFPSAYDETMRHPDVVVTMESDVGGGYAEQVKRPQKRRKPRPSKLDTDDIKAWRRK